MASETIPIYELLAQKYGFTVDQIEVPHPGNEQQSQWLTIRRAKPNYVVLRGWGVMNPVALKTAQKIGFPADHIIGNVWSNSEEDVIPAGDAAKGYIAITTQASGAEYPVLQEIIKTVYGAGKGNLEDKKRIGSVYHNLGIVNGILNVEAIRVAQEKFGHRTLTGDEVRWGFEHLKLDPARVEALGAKGLFHSINVTWDNHEGDGRVTFQQWDGEKWKVDLGLDRAGLEAAAADHREVVGSLRQGKRHQDSHLGQRSRRLSRRRKRGIGCNPDPAATPAAAARLRAAARQEKPMPAPDPLLNIAAIEAVYNRAIVAVHDVSLEVRDGEILALLGANGAGKTTTLKAVSNLLPAERGAITRGDIRFAGFDAQRPRPRRTGPSGPRASARRAAIASPR